MTQTETIIRSPFRVGTAQTKTESLILYLYKQIYPDDITNIKWSLCNIHNGVWDLIHLLCIAVDQLLAQKEQINRQMNERLLKNKKQTQNQSLWRFHLIYCIISKVERVRFYTDWQRKKWAEQLRAFTCLDPSFEEGFPLFHWSKDHCMARLRWCAWNVDNTTKVQWYNPCIAATL